MSPQPRFQLTAAGQPQRLSRDNPPQAWQDFEAWLSLVSLVGLFAAAIVHLVVGVSVSEKLSLPVG